MCFESSRAPFVGRQGGCLLRFRAIFREIPGYFLEKSVHILNINWVIRACFVTVYDKNHKISRLRRATIIINSNLRNSLYRSSGISIYRYNNLLYNIIQYRYNIIQYFCWTSWRMNEQSLYPLSTQARSMAAAPTGSTTGACWGTWLAGARRAR